MRVMFANVIKRVISRLPVVHAGLCQITRLQACLSNDGNWVRHPAAGITPGFRLCRQQMWLLPRLSLPAISVQTTNSHCPTLALLTLHEHLFSPGGPAGPGPPTAVPALLLVAIPGASLFPTCTLYVCSWVFSYAWKSWAAHIPIAVPFPLHLVFLESL